MNRPIPSDLTPRDQDSRDRISTSLHENLFVEAGAGTGKTTALVDRMIALVVDKDVAVEGIAAITFTERAAAELGDRFRRKLEDIAKDDPEQARRDRADTALGNVDLASLTTLHGFARRLLTDHPVEAGLPTGFELLDEVSSQLSFSDRWNELQKDLLDDDGLARTVLMADALGIQLSHLRDLTHELDERWDLLDPLPKQREPHPVSVDEILSLMGQAIALDREDVEEDDRLRIRLSKMRAARKVLAGASDEYDQLRLLSNDFLRRSLNVGNDGRKDVWGDDKEEIKRIAYSARDLWDESIRKTAGSVLGRLLAEMVDATLLAAKRRQRLGTLTFHDLLVLARDLLTNPKVGSSLRLSLHNRYRHILLDEFQDTDPIQLDLALLLTDPVTVNTADLADFTPTPGSLFMVGDPKQSIYRFRRADISLYLLARRSLGVAETALTENFRTTVPIIHWVNAIFGHLIGAGESLENEADHSALVQPGYTPLAGRRAAASVGPAVTILGRRAHGKELDASSLRQLEATDVANAITTAIVEKWTVEDRNGHQRPCGFGDIAVLIPSRASLPDLESALDESGVPYRAESSSLLFATAQIRDLLMVLRAIEDPTDDLAIVAALRTPYFGCGDDELAHWRVHQGGTWDHQASQPTADDTDNVVGAGLAWLGEMHRSRHHLGPSGILENLINDRRVLQIALGETRPRDAWRRVRLLSDRARAFAETAGGSLRGFVDWCLAQTDERSRVAETVLPEADDAAVRILTIHGAKGLEFPITVLSGMSTATAKSDRGARLLITSNRSVEVCVRENLETPGYKVAYENDLQFRDAETIRLLYVAATRARDHLVVSVHRATDIDPDKPGRPGLGRLLASALSSADGSETDFDLSPAAKALPKEVRRTGKSLPDRQSWVSEHQDVLARAESPSTISATGIAAQAAGGIEEDRARPGEVGRHGTGVGRAVHAVLEVLDFHTADPSAIVRECSAYEGVLDNYRTVDALVRAGLSSDSIQRAGATRHWRELYVAAPIDDHPEAPVIEGYVDLAFIENGPSGTGLVIVDYKTDAVANDSEREVKADRYRLQGATYALAAQLATGIPVHRVVLCFLATDGATEIEVADLDSAMAEVVNIAQKMTRG